MLVIQTISSGLGFYNMSVYMSFFVKASIDALSEFPAVNAEIDGNDIIYKNYYNIGVAVGTSQGLVVPVLKNADKMSFAETEATRVPSRLTTSLYPCALSKTTDQALGQLARDLVKAWGDRAMTLIELEEAIATAAEKAPTDNVQIQALREAISLVKNEYDAVVKEEESRVREAGGLHVIGTERHESRRVDNQLRGRAGRQAD